MILTLAVWLIVLTAASGYGRLLSPRNSQADSAESEFVGLYAGLLMVSAILLAGAVFTNLTVCVGLIVVLPGIVIYLRDGGLQIWNRDRFVIVAAVALFVSTREVNFYDTALYHQQAVKWLAEHGLVRGLALVYFRFGWVSSWFALAAPLNHGVTAGRAGIVGGLPFSLAVVACFEGLRSFFSRATNALSSGTWVFLCLLLSVVAVVWHVDTSLSPDMFVWLLPLVIVAILADRDATEADRFGRATLVAAMACLVKLTAAPALLYCFALLGWRWARAPHDRRKLSIFAALAGGALGLVIATNLITSGCPLFPSPAGCTSFAWSIGSDTARSVQTLVEHFARTSRHDQIYPLTAAAALASVILGAITRTSFVRHVLSMSWMGIAFILIVAPVPRYGLGFFLLPVAAAITAILERGVAAAGWHTSQLKSWTGASVALAGIAAIAVAAFSGGGHDLGSFLYPCRIAGANGDQIHIVNRAVDVRGALAIHAEKVGELTVWFPSSSDQCWDAPLPCTPNLTHGDLRLRRKGDLDTGFLTP